MAGVLDTDRIMYKMKLILSKKQATVVSRPGAIAGEIGRKGYPRGRQGV